MKAPAQEDPEPLFAALEADPMSGVDAFGMKEPTLGKEPERVLDDIRQVREGPDGR